MATSYTNSAPIQAIAQSFGVNNDEGIFITSVALFFSEKDTTLPIRVEIRPLVNGVPSSTERVPGTLKFLAPGSVNTSSDCSTATTFTFDEPAFLVGRGEYCIVVSSSSTKYKAFIAEIGEFQLNSTELRVSSQPAAGSLFKSQNGSTWTAVQEKDLVHQIYIASFDVLYGGTAIFENGDLPTWGLAPNPFSVDSGSTTVRVYHPYHGLVSGDDAVTTGLPPSASIGGIAGSSISGTRPIIDYDLFGYTFAADSAATSFGVGGGTGVKAIQNAMYNIAYPNIQYILPDKTSMSYGVKQTSGSSMAGTETAYQKDTTYANFVPFENIYNTFPKMVANAANQTVQLGAGIKSTTMKFGMTTKSWAVSPIIDAQRTDLYLIENIIDRPNVAATSGYNVPITFVAETDKSWGSAAAKFLTNRVTLEEDAVGLKIIIGANRPSGAYMDVYYRTGTDDVYLDDTPWVQATLQGNVPTDETTSVIRDYEYLVGGDGGNLLPFTQFQVKIVFTSTNSSKVAVVQDLRVLALST